MLYNPSWDPLQSTLQDLISFLESQPSKESYIFSDSEHCLLCKFLNSKGVSQPIVNRMYWHLHTGAPPALLPPHFNYIAEGSVWSFSDDRHTYGAALERARKYLP
jgi:hypothetical protein